MLGTPPMKIWLYQTLPKKINLYNRFIDHFQLSTRIVHKMPREAKLRLINKTDIKDISSARQSGKRVKPAQDAKCKCVSFG